MDVLGREDGNMEKLGSIAEVWTSTVAVPAVGAPSPVAGITGEKSSDLDVGIGLKLLADALAGLGAGLSLPSLNLAFKKAKKVQFKFINVESTSVTPFGLGKFLANGTLDMSNPFVSHYFGNDETQEYIIFDVLKSDSISVAAKTETGTTVEADLGALSGALKANVTGRVEFGRRLGNHVHGPGESDVRLQALRSDVRERQVGAERRWRRRRPVLRHRRRRRPLTIEPVVLAQGRLLRLR